MRILLDYRPALRERTGVGEYVHELARALLQPPVATDESLMLFTSSWKDRPSPEALHELRGATVTDLRLPVRALTWAWHRAEWPPIEMLAGATDVVHGQSPLLIPARRAAQIVTIHDLDFLKHPGRTHAEMRRDYPKLVRRHAARAHHVVVSSRYAAGEVERELGVPSTRISVCSPGPPAWTAEVAAKRGRDAAGGYILFLGSLEPRKNIAGLLAAYAIARGRDPRTPPLVLAGRVTAPGRPAVEALAGTALAPHVQLRGYVPSSERPALLEGARMLVLPSFEEGFGLPVLEAMASGVPVVVSNRGSLPEVAGGAAQPCDPDDHETLAGRMLELLQDDAAKRATAAGLAQAGTFSWRACAQQARSAYRAAVDYANRG